MELRLRQVRNLIASPAFQGPLSPSLPPAHASLNETSSAHELIIYRTPGAEIRDYSYRPWELMLFILIGIACGTPP